MCYRTFLERYQFCSGSQHSLRGTSLILQRENRVSEWSLVCPPNAKHATPSAPPSPWRCGTSGSPPLSLRFSIKASGSRQRAQVKICFICPVSDPGVSETPLNHPDGERGFVANSYTRPQYYIIPLPRIWKVWERNGTP